MAASTSRTRGWIAPMLAAGIALVALHGRAPGQLRPEEVLVLYDSRNADSLAVAEYYAGSKNVPGGAGGLPGARPGVRVLDLASTGAPLAAPGNISFTDYAARLRNPVRTWLTAMGLSGKIRSLVTTKGMPHRLLDTDFPACGDNPTNLVNEYNASDATCASVDAELALLWQNTETGEAGGPGDSKLDGVIVNPFWKSTTPIWTFPQTNITVQKTFTGNGPGPTWQSFGATGSPTRFSPGDMYLVSRLDGTTVADVRGMIDRAQRILYDVDAHVVLLDESDSNGLADSASNSEFDNIDTAFPALRDADDYEVTRNELQADTRFAAGFTRYDAASGGGAFFVGPRLSWQGSVLLVNEPVVLLATYGANHNGRPFTTGGTIASTIYGTSFNYPNGAIFNTIESYNGRDFAGLGQLDYAMQQQAASFLAAGGTFALGNVWEPLADTVPDNRYLARNFVRGNLSWAEAAWSAIPALSWMQMVLGDPLARPFRTSEDINRDGRVDIDDLYAWEASPADVDRNGSTNAADRAFVVNALRSWERADMLTRRP